MKDSDNNMMILFGLASAVGFTRLSTVLLVAVVYTRQGRSKGSLLLFVR